MLRVVMDGDPGGALLHDMPLAQPGEEGIRAIGVAGTHAQRDAVPLFEHVRGWDEIDVEAMRYAVSELGRLGEVVMPKPRS